MAGLVHGGTQPVDALLAPVDPRAGAALVPAPRRPGRAWQLRGTLRPSDEQAAIIDAVYAGRDVIVQARAGTGKTATLAMATQACARRRALYLAYNKAAAQDAARRFGRDVTCRTLHSVAYAHAADWMKERLGMPRQSGRMVADILGLRDQLLIRKGAYGAVVDLRLGSAQLARIALETVRRFCYSAEPEPAAVHVPRQLGFSDAAHEQLTQLVVPWAELIWIHACCANGQLRYEHDYYLKYWCLTEPQLAFDLVLLDEAQDSNKLTSQLIREQWSCQTAIIGDPCQQLYAWRGATDAMQDFPDHETLYLTTSYRFGAQIAERGNVFLRLLDARPLVQGHPDLVSRVVTGMTDPDAVLCRTNAGAMREVIRQIEDNVPVYLEGGGAQIRALAEAAQELVWGNGTSHPELAAFGSWGEVQDYVEQDPGGSDLRAFVRLVDDHGPQVIISAVDNLQTTAKQARVTVSTMHKSKGLQWQRVRIGTDVPGPTSEGESGMRVATAEPELMLNYVAVTRAQAELDAGPLGEFDDADSGIPAEWW